MLCLLLLLLLLQDQDSDFHQMIPQKKELKKELKQLEEEEEEEEEQDGDEEDQTNSAPFDTTGYGDEDDDASNDGEARGDRGGAGAEDGDAGSGPEEESEDFKRHTYRPKSGQDIYGRAVGAGPGGAAPAMYVPPHLRAVAAAAAAAATSAVGASNTEADKFAPSSKRTEVQVMLALRLGIVGYEEHGKFSLEQDFGVCFAAQAGAAGRAKCRIYGARFYFS